MKSFLVSSAVLLTVAIIVSAAPGELTDNEVPYNKKFLKKKAVSADFGGYHAAAGLGGDSSGGGLYANAGSSSGASASAGLYGGSGANGAAYASNTNEYYSQAGGGRDAFFDKIFAIPINVLHSVNDYVKTKGEGGAAGAGISAGAESGSGGYRFGGASAGAEAGAGIGAGASAGASASAGSEASHGKRIRSGEHYDKVFNIPISALKSVNDFLNG